MEGGWRVKKRHKVSLAAKGEYAVKVELLSKRKDNEKGFMSRSSKQQPLNDSLVLNHNIVSVCLCEMG